MKSSVLFVLIVFAFGSCSLLDPPLSFGNPRSVDEPSGTSGPPRPDTLMLVSAVEFPASYDWQRDSAFGNVSCTLRLFRNGEEALSIPAGRGTTVSAAPDGHHIIDGDLYTVYTDTRGTFIGRNGSGLASWAEREFIVGILPGGESVYTLGYSYGGGLSFRRDGAELYSDPAGTVFGGFSTDTYGPTGALYAYDGGVCFAYSRPGEVCFVRDGELLAAVPAPSPVLLDAKFIGGGPAVLYNSSRSTFLMQSGRTGVLCPRLKVCWTSAGLVEYCGRVCAAGKCGIWHEPYGWGIGSEESLYRIAGHPDYLFFSGGNCLPLELSGEGVGDCRFLRRSCAGTLDGEFALALTPRDPALHPFVLFKGEKTEYPVCGFVSGVDFYITD